MFRLRLALAVALAVIPVLGAQPVLAASPKSHHSKTRIAAMTVTPVASPAPVPAATPVPPVSAPTVRPGSTPAPVTPAPVAAAIPLPPAAQAPVPTVVQPVVERVVEIRPGDPAQVTFAAAPAPRAPTGLTPLTAVGLGSVPGLAGLLAVLLVLRARRRDEEVLAIDDLTGVLRRGTGLVAAARELERARRHGEPLTAAFIDVDGLKQVNDSRGHAAGDQLLRAVAATLSSRLRAQDLVLRYGGDEFVCLLPDTSRAAAARLLAGVRDGLAARAEVIFSFGLAELAPAESLDALLARADAELYAERSRRRAVR